jgi:hypothetical protein
MSARRTSTDQHKRMARTLGCLVASMTIGAAVLDWFQPAHQAGATPRRQLIAQIREAIHQPAEGSALPQRWHAIRVDPQRGADRTAQAPAHFVVDPDGHWSLTEHWNNQQPLGEEGVVRIGLRTPPNSNQITPVQWVETRQLIGSLQDMCHITRQGLILSKALALAPDASPKPKTN